MWDGTPLYMYIMCVCKYGRVCECVYVVCVACVVCVEGGRGDSLTSSRTWMESGVICCASFKELAASFSCPHMRKISAVLHQSHAQHSLLKPT